MNSRGDLLGPQNDHHARRLAGDPAHRGAQRPAESFAAHADDVAQGVFDVHAHQRRQCRIQVALHQRDVHSLVDVVLVQYSRNRPNSVSTLCSEMRSTERSLRRR